jgi:hypothetical protein
VCKRTRDEPENGMPVAVGSVAFSLSLSVIPNGIRGIQICAAGRCGGLRCVCVCVRVCVRVACVVILRSSDGLNGALDPGKGGSCQRVPGITFCYTADCGTVVCLKALRDRKSGHLAPEHRVLWPGRGFINSFSVRTNPVASSGARMHQENSCVPARASSPDWALKIGRVVAYSPRTDAPGCALPHDATRPALSGSWTPIRGSYSWRP